MVVTTNVITASLSNEMDWIIISRLRFGRGLVYGDWYTMVYHSMAKVSEYVEIVDPHGIVLSISMVIRGRHLGRISPHIEGTAY